LLQAMLGKAAGRHLHALAHNLDPRRVETGRRRRSVGAQRARGRRPWTPGDLDADLQALVDRVTRRLRGGRRVARTVVLRLRFDDFSRATRSATLTRSTASTETILRTARELLHEALPTLEAKGATLIGISVTNLEDVGRIQLAIPFDDRHLEDLDEALDTVRERFGATAVTRGTLVGRDTGIAMPALPDPPEPHR
jgi:DNA polymerase IV